MRSRRNFKVQTREVQEHAQRFLTPIFGKKGFGFKCTVTAVLQVLLVAASRTISVFAACLQMGTLSDQAARNALRAALPKRWQAVEAKLNQALHEPLPGKTRKRTLAIDLHEIPYHGEPQQRNHVVHKKPKAGTTTFFAYATACLVEKGHRYTLGYTWVRRTDTDIAVVQRLLACIERSGVRIRRLLLDRGFFNVALMHFLQAQNIPFLLPVVFRGRKPKRGKKHTGLRAFLLRAAGWYKHTQRWKGQEVTFGVCVAYKSYRHHRTGKRRSKKLVFAAWRVQGTPTEIREWYRKRFGIETSYRQLGQARIRTSTRDPLLRLLFVGLALLLRNIWVWLQWLLFGEEVQREQGKAVKRFQFRRLLSVIARSIESHLQPDPQLT